MDMDPVVYLCGIFSNTYECEPPSKCRWHFTGYRHSFIFSLILLPKLTQASVSLVGISFLCVGLNAPLLSNDQPKQALVYFLFHKRGSPRINIRMNVPKSGHLLVNLGFWISRFPMFEIVVVVAISFWKIWW